MVKVPYNCFLLICEGSTAFKLTLKVLALPIAQTLTTLFKCSCSLSSVSFNKGCEWAQFIVLKSYTWHSIFLFLFILPSLFLVGVEYSLSHFYFQAPAWQNFTFDHSRIMRHFEGLSVAQTTGK